MTKKLTFPQRLAREVTTGAYVSATWWHVLWLLVPIAGIVGFVIAVEDAHRENLRKS